jgi:hypothetical protein
MSGPYPGKQGGGSGAGFGFAAATGLEFNICTDADLAENHHGFRQRRHPLSPEKGCESVSGVVTANFFEGQQGRLTPAVCGSVKPLVVKED